MNTAPSTGKTGWIDAAEAVAETHKLAPSAIKSTPRHIGISLTYAPKTWLSEAAGAGSLPELAEQHRSGGALVHASSFSRNGRLEYALSIQAVATSLPRQEAAASYTCPVTSMCRPPDWSPRSRLTCGLSFATERTDRRRDIKSHGFSRAAVAEFRRGCTRVSRYSPVVSYYDHRSSPLRY